MSLDPAVEALIDTGQLVGLYLIRIDLPGRPVGYHQGGRNYPYNGLVYRPNRFLDIGDMRGGLGVAVTTRTIRFSNIPSEDPDDAIARIEEFNYLNAPVIITYLAGVPDTNQVAGILVSSLYEISKVKFPISAADSKGERTFSIVMEIEPHGRSARGATHVKRSQVEHQYDNDATDTCLENATASAQVPEEWGQRG